VPIMQTLHQYWFTGWAFDWLYDHIFVFPLVWFSKINKNDFIDQVYTGIAALNRFGNRFFSRTQTGNLRWYAVGLAFGALVTITIVMFL
jgi:NADH-quinone oxidoreductase subunit L